LPAKTYPYPPVRAARGPSPRPNTDSIVDRRDRLMADLVELRKSRAGSRHIENAYQLLTRRWSGSTWKARAGLLTAAAWLVEVERSCGPGVSMM
jgi:hypothetical protein